MKISLQWNPTKIAYLIYSTEARQVQCLTEEMIPLSFFGNLRKVEAQHPISQVKGISNGNSQIVLWSMVVPHYKLMAVKMTSITIMGTQQYKLYRTMKTSQILKRPIKSSKLTLKLCKVNKSIQQKRTLFREKSEKCKFLPESKFFIISYQYIGLTCLPTRMTIVEDPQIQRTLRLIWQASLNQKRYPSRYPKFPYTSSSQYSSPQVRCPQPKRTIKGILRRVKIMR